jgi:hypothetical protein
MEDETFEEWVATRPQIIKDLAALYPPGALLLIQKKQLYVLGYTESGGLLVSETDPCEEYARAVETRQLLCGRCIGFHGESSTHTDQSCRP